MTIAEFPKDYDPKKHSLFNGLPWREVNERLLNTEEMAKAFKAMAKTCDKAQDKLGGLDVYINKDIEENDAYMVGKNIVKADLS